MKSHLLFCFVVVGDQGCFFLASLSISFRAMLEFNVEGGNSPGPCNPKRLRKESFQNMQKSSVLWSLVLFQRAEDYAASVAWDIVFDAVSNHQKSNRHRKRGTNNKRKKKNRKEKWKNKNAHSVERGRKRSIITGFYSCFPISAAARLSCKETWGNPKSVNRQEKVARKSDGK